MKFSFKKINIEAPFPTTQAGHSVQTFLVYEFKDHLFGRVFSFKDDNNWIMHVSLDVLAFTVDQRNKLQNKVREALHNDKIHVITSATHTHYANSTRNEEYSEWLINRLAEEIATMQYEEVGEVTSSYQRIQEPVVGKSRISGYETNNEFLVLVRFFAQGKCILTWVINNCHPTTLAATSPFFSAEYPGYSLKILEEKHPGENFTFGMGPAGDMSTRFTRKDQSYESMVELATKLANRVEDLLKENAQQKPITLNYKEADMNYEHEFGPIDMSKIRSDISPREMETIRIGQEMRAKLQETKMFMGAKFGTQILASWDLGSMKLVFFPNEMFSEYLNELNLENTYLLSYSNGYGPYVLPPDFEYITYEMFIDTTTKNTKMMIKKIIKEI